jgi:hypothetical protein
LPLAENFCFRSVARGIGSWWRAAEPETGGACRFHFAERARESERLESAMKLVLACYGSCGHVEPCLAVGCELLCRGHEVRMAVPPDLVGFAESAGLPKKSGVGEKTGVGKSIAILGRGREIVVGMVTAMASSASTDAVPPRNTKFARREIRSLARRLVRRTPYCLWTVRRRCWTMTTKETAVKRWCRP